jgi:hypothetical protein
MGMAMLRKEEDGREGSGPACDVPVFDKLRELTRNGYVPDPAQPLAGTGILLRHESAPNLILQPDGSIDLPLGQEAKPVSAAVVRPRMAKLRILTIAVLAVGFWFLSVAITASILEGM